MQRLEHRPAKPAARRNGQVRILGDVLQAVEVRNLAVEHVPHEEMLGQANAPEFGQLGNGSNPVHRCAAHPSKGHCDNAARGVSNPG